MTNTNETKGGGNELEWGDQRHASAKQKGTVSSVMHSEVQKDTQTGKTASERVKLAEAVHLL